MEPYKLGNLGCALAMAGAGVMALGAVLYGVGIFLQRMGLR